LVWKRQIPFTPAGTPSAAYTDSRNKSKEYVLTDEEKTQFKAFYRQAYAETFSALIQSEKYREADDVKKCRAPERRPE
jgi:hypothetical protein